MTAPRTPEQTGGQARSGVREAGAAPSVRELLRAARNAVSAPAGALSDSPLEARHMPAAAPRITPGLLREQGPFARPVGAPVVTFGGFLDGVQDSRVVTWLSGIPLIVASVGAVVLERVERELAVWRDARVRRVLLLPRALVPPAVWDAIAAAAPLEDSGGDATARHPESLLASAVERVDAVRAAEERTLAEFWVASAAAPLWVDGGISGLGAASRSPWAVGVVKSHRTIYVEPDALPELFALPVDARTRVFAPSGTGPRAGVWSWYVRMRAPSSGDPLHGLVRVEVAASDEDVTARSDAVSSWVLAERTPIALPDARWDVMAYGVARCEAYLKRGLGLHLERGFV